MGCVAKKQDSQRYQGRQFLGPHLADPPLLPPHLLPGDEHMATFFSLPEKEITKANNWWKLTFTAKFIAAKAQEHLRYQSCVVSEGAIHSTFSLSIPWRLTNRQGWKYPCAYQRPGTIPTQAYNLIIITIISKGAILFNIWVNRFIH